MAAQELDFEDLDRRMTGAVAALKSEFSGLRTGREPLGASAGRGLRINDANRSGRHCDSS